MADVVPLRGENRVIVREGMKRMESTARPGLRALLEAAGTAAPLRADALAFRLGPRLNAAGRLGDASLGVQLLLTGKPDKAFAAARQLEEMNRARQDAEREITAAAFRQVEETLTPDTRVLLAAGEGWNPGLIGLSAGRLCEKYTRPAIVLSIPEDGPAVGSCRSVPGVHIFEALQACSDLLVRFGGHAQAAGLSVMRENIPALRERLNRLFLEQYDDSCFTPSREYDLALPFRTWTPETLAQLDLLEPTGCGNPAPVFLLSGAEIRSMRRVGRDGAHLQINAADADGTPVPPTRTEPRSGPSPSPWGRKRTKTRRKRICCTPPSGMNSTAGSPSRPRSRRSAPFIPDPPKDHSHAAPAAINRKEVSESWRSHPTKPCRWTRC